MKRELLITVASAAAGRRLQRAQGSGASAQGVVSCSSWALECAGFSSCGMWA